MTDNNAIKVILIGETGDGKTNLIRVTLGKEFESNSCSTLTSSFYDCKINVNNKIIYITYGIQMDTKLFAQ